MATTVKRRRPAGNGAATNRGAAALPGQVVLVLQGGGALGAYQVGVYEALHEAGIEPDWVIGTSIGAINAALIAGNCARAPDGRGCASSGRASSKARNADLMRFFTGLPNMAAESLHGQPRHSLLLRPESGRVAVARTFRSAWRRPPTIRTAPLRETLSELVEFDCNSSGHTRLTVGAVNARNGEMRYFDSREEEIRVDHILASGALPPAFPAVRIDGDPYWDGGIYSNTPIEAVLDDNPRRDSVIFTVNVWNPEGTEPESVWEVMGRTKDIQFASRAKSHIARQKQIHHLRHIIRELAKRVPDKMRVVARSEGTGGVGLRHDDARRASQCAESRRRGPHQGHRLHAGRHPRALAGRLCRHAAHAGARTLDATRSTRRTAS